MASWKTKGYVSDSEDDDEDTDVLTRPTTNTTQDLIANHAACTSATVGSSEDKSQVPKQILEDVCKAPILDSSTPKAPSQHEDDTHDKSAGVTAEPVQASTTTAEKLQESINKGLSLVREALSRSTSPQPALATADDSPLSTPPDSPILLPLLAQLASASDQEVVSGVVPNVSQHAFETVAPRRTFRQRNAIQQHPYSLEYAVYLKHCNERGIKPVHLPKAAAPILNGNGAESQDVRVEDDSQNQDSYGQESIELDELQQINDNELHNISSDLDGDVNMDVDGDLPDLQALFEKRPGQRRLNKQRRAQPSGHPRSRSAELQQIYEMSSEDELRTPLMLKGTKISAKTQQESFPSPPRSMSVDTVEAKPFTRRGSPDLSPIALPTPILSSEVRPRKRPVIEDDTQSGQEEEHVQVIPILSESESESSSSDSKPESPVNVRFMQKKVKGVLPASWWTVDRAQKVLDAKKQGTANASAKPLQEIGVAQRKTASTPGRDRMHPSKTTWYEDLVSDDDDADGASTISVSESREADTEGLISRRSTPAVDSEAMEIADDDGFDPMLPTRNRTETGRRRRQTNLRGYIQERQKPQKQATFASRVHQRISNQQRPRKKTRQKAPSEAVHVLDAPDLQGSVLAPRPTFLRLAARQGRAQGTKPGVSPSRKFFQLENEDDTTDMLDELRIWKETQRTRRPALPADQGRSKIQQANKRASAANEDISRSAAARDKPDGIARPSTSRVPPVGPTQVQQQADLGQVILCDLGQTEDNALRLTRLRSLLPLTNRSGRGRFAFQLAEPRNAQLEVLRPDHRGLRRHIHGARHRPPQSAGVLRERSQGIQSPNSDSNVVPAARKSSKRTRKQTPVFRPKLQQTRLAPASPNSRTLEDLIGQTSPNIRVLLEKEFAEHQAAWFQGSKSGIMVANQKTQRHFQVFLDVLQSYLPVALQDAEDSREARELRSFLHRLIPNRGQIGAQGQIGDKVLEVLEYDILVARNVFDLHTCLLKLAPGHAPRPRVLEMKVNFSDAHHEICVIALAAWTNIYNCHHQDTSIVEGLAAWIFSILSQLIARWKAAETDARVEAVQSMRRVDEQLVRKVIEFNRKQASELLTRALVALSLGIKNATGLIEANALLDHRRYQETLSTIAQLPEMDDVVLKEALAVATAYVRQQWHLQHPALIPSLLNNVRQALTHLTVSRVKCSSDLYHITSEVYFTVATAAVGQRQRSWDEFTEPRSSHSLDMFVAASHLNSMKTFFYHYLLEHEPSQYELELRVPVLSHWLRILLQVTCDSVGRSLLTASLFRHEKESLAMSSLAALFQSPESVVDGSTLRDCLPEIRYAAVMHIIKTVHGQENNAEADWLVGGLEEVDAPRLLKIMFTTMKETWMSLSEQPEEQDVYTVLIHSALDQYQTYPRADFTIDLWFFNSSTFPQRRTQTLAKLLTSRFDTDEEFLSEADEQFGHELKHARKYGRLTSLQDELKDLLLPTEVGVMRSPDEYTDVLLRHAKFVKGILHKMMDSSDPGYTDVRTMSLRVLVYVLHNLECRIDTLALTTTQPLIEAMLPIVSVVRYSHVSASAYDQQLVYAFMRLTLTWAVTTLSELPDGFVGDVKAICESAAETGGEEASMLLEAVMHMT